MKLVLGVVILAVTLTGCISAYRPPPGIVWAYTNESAAYPHMRTVGYSESKENCERARARDAEGTAKNHPWLLATVSAVCHQAVVVPGDGYWAFAIPPKYFVGHAAATLDLCDRLRQSQPPPVTAISVPTACAPVSIRCPDQSARTGQAEPPSRQAAAESSIWGYTAVSETMASFSLVAYAGSKIDCEASRARDLYTVERDSPWLKTKIEECRSALVLPGNDYWTFNVNQNRLTLGATTQEMCVRLRDEARKQAQGPTTDCTPVSVRFQGKP